MRTAKIISAASIGIQRTVDLEVDHPDHQFLVNGLLTSNSHANAYSYLGYVCQYLKTNYPLEWWTSVLRNSSIQDLKKNSEHCADMVAPPNINTSDTDFFIAVSDKIVYPLRMVRGVASSAEDIVAARGNTPFESFEDFWNRIPRRKVNKGVVKALVWVGAMDDLAPDGEDLREKRNALWQQYLSFRGEEDDFVPKDEFEALKLQDELMPFGTPDLADYIAELTDCNSPADARRLWDDIPERLREGYNAPRFEFAGLVSAARRHMTKNSKPMMFIDISGADANLSVLAFEDVIQTIPQDHLTALLAGGCVVRAMGRLSERNGKLSLIANGISVLNQPQLNS